MRYEYLITILIIIFAISGCSSCRTVSHNEEQMVMVDEQYSDTEFYFIDVPYYENVTHSVEETGQVIQYFELSACGDYLTIENPSDKPITLLFKVDASGYYKVHSMTEMQGLDGVSTYYALVYPDNKNEGLLSPLTQLTIQAYESTNLRFKGIPNENSILCLDSADLPCTSFDECDPSIGNNIFDIDMIKKEDISIKNPLYAKMNKVITEPVKSYKKVQRNRTVIKTKKIVVPKNVTVTSRVCD